MRKITAFVLTLALALSMSATAFAAESTVIENGGQQDIDVNAKYVNGVETPTKYSVDVEWGAMEFTYTVSGTKTWDEKTHQYSVSSSGAWAASGNEIYVTNHSNTEIKADFTYTGENTYNTVTDTFFANSLTLPTAVGKATDAAELKGTTALTLGGALESGVTDFTKVGTVTVTISKP